MRKLTLESLQVESFHTTAGAPPARGTVNGHAAPATAACGTGASECALCQDTVFIGCEPGTYDPKACGETNYMDCTYGCTYQCSANTGCNDVCWVYADTPNCAID